MVKLFDQLFKWEGATARVLRSIKKWTPSIKEALATILTKKIMFWKLVNSFKMMK